MEEEQSLEQQFARLAISERPAMQPFEAQLYAEFERSYLEYCRYVEQLESEQRGNEQAQQPGGAVAHPA